MPQSGLFWKCARVCAWSQGQAGNCSVISALAAKAAPTAPSDVGAHQLSYKLPQAQPLVRRIHDRSHLTPPVLAPRSRTSATAALVRPYVHSPALERSCGVCSRSFINHMTFLITRIPPRKIRNCMTKREYLRKQKEGCLAQQLQSLQPLPPHPSGRVPGVAVVQQPPKEDTLTAPARWSSGHSSNGNR